MQKHSGFTTIELVTVIIILVTAGTIFLLQKNDTLAYHRDEMRKTALNAIYYNLEEVVYPTLRGYPAKLDEKQLKALDSALLKDQRGTLINAPASEYRYEPSSCDGAVCAHYTLRSTLEKEADFIKRSRN